MEKLHFGKFYYLHLIILYFFKLHFLFFLLLIQTLLMKLFIKYTHLKEIKLLLMLF